MQLKFSGDFSDLNRFRQQLEQAPEILTVVSKNLAEEAIELVREGIAEGHDPYGKKYAPLVLRDGNPLEDTGRLKVWHRVTATRQQFAIASTVDYAKYHQEGTGIYGPKKRRIKPLKARALRIPVRGGSPLFRRSVEGTPQRMMVPRPGDLPSSWRSRFIDTAHEVLTEHFK